MTAVFVAYVDYGPPEGACPPIYVGFQLAEALDRGQADVSKTNMIYEEWADGVMVRRFGSVGA